MTHPDWCETHEAYDCDKPDMRKAYPGQCRKQWEAINNGCPHCGESLLKEPEQYIITETLL